VIEFFVPGCPVPGGSKRAFPVHGRDGRIHMNVADTSGPKGKEWRAAIRLAAGQALTNAGILPYEGSHIPSMRPLRLSLLFFVRRPKSHYGKRGLLPRAPLWPTTKPDVLKLARAIEDACTGILWRDDAQIVEEELRKGYADGVPIGVRIIVTALTDRRAEGRASEELCT